MRSSPRSSAPLHLSGGTGLLALDCRGHRGGLASVFGFAAPLAGRPTPAGELLVDVLAGPQLVQLAAAHSGMVPFKTTIPNDVSLFGRSIYVQGLCSGSPSPQLSNALDVVIGR